MIIRNYSVKIEVFIILVKKVVPINQIIIVEYLSSLKLKAYFEEVDYFKICYYFTSIISYLELNLFKGFIKNYSAVKP